VRELAATYPEGGDPALIPLAHRRLFQLFNPLADRGMSRVRIVALRPVDELRENPHFEVGVATMRRGYDARVAATDAMLGKLRAHLEALGLWEDTLLVVTSDHGEAFFEHDQPWHGYVPYEEVLRVPWIISYPRLFERLGAQRVDAPVWHLDFVPTLLALAGLPPDPSLPGRDLTPALSGRETLPADHPVFPLVLEVDTLNPEPPRRVSIRAPLKFVPHHPRFRAAGDQLFDLAADPGETENLIGARAADAANLVQLVAEYESQLREPPPTADSRTLDEAEAEALRELGYLE
jgi:arylsulfatase A-like enzyme